MPRPRPPAHPLITGERRKGSATGTSGTNYKDIDELAVSLVEQAREQTELAPLNIKVVETTSLPHPLVKLKSFIAPEPADTKIVKPLLSSGPWKHPGTPNKVPLISPETGRVPYDSTNPQLTMPDSYYIYQNASQQWILLYTDSAQRQVELYLSQLMEDPKDVKDLDAHANDLNNILTQAAAQKIPPDPVKINKNPVGRAIRNFRQNSQRIAEYGCRKYSQDPKVLEFTQRVPNMHPIKIFTYTVTLVNGQPKYSTEPSHPNESDEEMKLRIRGFLEFYKEHRIRIGCPQPIVIRLTSSGTDNKFRTIAEEIAADPKLNLKITVLNLLKDEVDKDKDKKDENKTDPKKPAETNNTTENENTITRRARH